jgi:thiol-disulfide isomerase/thioredoxin
MMRAFVCSTLGLILAAASGRGVTPYQSGGDVNAPAGGTDAGDTLLLVGGDQISSIASSGQSAPFLASSGLVAVLGDEIYVAKPQSTRPKVTVYNIAGVQVRTIPVPAELPKFTGYVVIPDGRVAFLDNIDDTIGFADRTGKYLRTVRMRRQPDDHLQNTAGTIVDNRLIVSEDGDKRLLAVDLDTYEVTVFRDLKHLPGPWLGAITAAEGKVYLCTPNQVFSFSPDDATEHHVATLPEGVGNITGIVYQAGRLFVVANSTGDLHEIDVASGTTRRIAGGLDYPEGLVSLPRTAVAGHQLSSGPILMPDQESVSVETFLKRLPVRKPKYVIPEENLTIPEDLKVCAENLGKIDVAIQKYRKDHGKPPNWLSDLVPSYLGRETSFCPNDPVHSARYSPDPRLPCSYSWQLSSNSIPPGWDASGRISYRDWKDQEAKAFGGVVPMVRCTHHGDDRVLNLSIDGQVYWSQLSWEHMFRLHYRVGDARSGRAATQAEDESVVGKPAPPFTLQDLSGKQVSLSDFKGKVVLLDFWATWCPPCAKAIPHIAAIYAKYRDEGLVVLGLNDEADRAKVEEFAKDRIPYAVLLNAREQFAEYGVTGIPTLFYIDKEGKVRYRDVGFTDGDEQEVDRSIKEMLGR